MIKLFFLIVFLLSGSYPLKADEVGSDQNFIKQLDNVKNPFEDGLPKPVIVPPPPIVQHVEPVRHRRRRPRPKPVPPPVIELPHLVIQGVMVGEDMHEVIINDQVVPLQGFIEGAQVIQVTKAGVILLFKGKKFFLNVD